MLCALLVALCAAAAADRPHIVLIVADDLGWNDVGFHGSNQVPTPNIDALAYSGLILHDYYVTPICTPSRAALMTGKYPIHTGMQHGVIYGTEPRGLPLSERILPQHLKTLGYSTHLVGKWHLGHFRKEYLPLHRGFDSHTGFWTGKIDMYDHTSQERGTWGTDFRRGFQVAHDLFGQYATDVYTNEAIKPLGGYSISWSDAIAHGKGISAAATGAAKVIKAHNKTSPLFLMVAHSAVHSGNPSEFLRAPDAEIAKFAHIQDLQRRKFAAMLSKLDESVGRVVETLDSEGLLASSVVVFTTDNGGPAAGFNDNAASNYPLRGVKNTLWEGGVRGAALLWSPLLDKKARVASQRMHIADWLPTLLSAAGGNSSELENIDGLDLWSALCSDGRSARTAVLHNIDDEYGSAAITVDQWKLHKGTNYNGAWDAWYGPGGRAGAYDAAALAAAPAGAALARLGLLPAAATIALLRARATVECGAAPDVACRPLQAPCLFNVEQDPCERVNLADEKPEIVQRLLAELDKMNRTAVPPNNKSEDPRGDPKFWGRVFTNFGDYQTNDATLCL